MMDKLERRLGNLQAAVVFLLTSFSAAADGNAPDDAAFTAECKRLSAALVTEDNNEAPETLADEAGDHNVEMVYAVNDAHTGAYNTLPVQEPEQIEEHNENVMQDNVEEFLEAPSVAEIGS